ncbi:hypothetical protein G6F57_010970 [Rhizopus arrhizus]|uniref:Uncharacterized protein n=1 Tax=Rhizopus oryzae TaxID=64495 RepID=A0A9P7BNC1_RHIOR|nr:hypothetical protein G6F23_012130 [Rhizopus arrhizus]KAG1407088.1 hypothetical protein G6F58_009723 [Rhizopus delemar]KAG0761086.1 hypothetical protein G6F24_007823 [Rhizopus arrhizus]KAG0791745.1 hypothetical protein G6F21_004856 [Rhizopus arrhizus]KAG0809677.1 hypothetical protein G6F20_008581 [Rhizopus arrhizus]
MYEVRPSVDVQVQQVIEAQKFEVQEFVIQVQRKVEVFVQYEVEVRVQQKVDVQQTVQTVGPTTKRKFRYTVK